MIHLKTLLRTSCRTLNSPQQRGLLLRPRSIFSSSRKKVGPPYSHIVQLGDPVLRVKCDPVEASDIKSEEVQEIIKTMKFVINRFDCLGLSAPQIGVPLQIMMCQFTERQFKFWSEEIQNQRGMEVIPMKIFINPKLNVLDSTQVRNINPRV